MKILALVLLMGMVATALVDIVQRRLGFGLIIGALEITEVLMAGVIFLMLTDVQRQKSHLSVEFVFNRMPGRAQTVVGSITVFLGLAACALLLQQSIDISIHSWMIQEVRHGVTQTPYWPARFVVSIGLFVFCMQLAIDFVRNLGVKW